MDELFDNFDAAEAFATNMGVVEDDDPKRPVEEPVSTESDPPSGEPGADDEGGEPSTEGDEPDGEPEANGAGDESDPPGDDPEIELKIGDKTEKVKASDLAKLYQTQAELTQRQAEVAEQVEQARVGSERANTALNSMLERAQERFKPYQDLNYFLLAQRMEPADFEQLQKDAQAAYADVQFISQELDKAVQTQRDESAKAWKAAADEAVKVLSDPKTGIKDFGEKVYGDIVEYATSAGVPREAVLQITDPHAIKMIHKAMLYDRAQTTVQPKPAVPAGPRRTLRPASANSASTTKTTRQRAVDNLRKSGGSIDAAADAFLASFGED